ncbi:hypothetical protein [Desulfonatronospira thiodismutans]|uniref:hypothetical protein n=1 Tax=Desulfonatronospira thiodismutans TaxID=488939 RepID=UPI0011863D49|nr:hypothetical protein [Desulfonatronospira thiodismutans]
MVFGERSQALAQYIEEKTQGLLKRFSHLNPDSEWLQGEGTPVIAVLGGDSNRIGLNSLFGYECVFLAGALDAEYVEKCRDYLQRQDFEKGPFVFLLPVSEPDPDNIYKKETLIKKENGDCLDLQLAADFVHDFCAFLMFPNEISADAREYYGLMEGKSIKLSYSRIYPEDPGAKLRLQPGVKDLFFVLYVDSQQQVLATASEILQTFESKGIENIWFSDVCMSSVNKIMCLYC